MQKINVLGNVEKEDLQVSTNIEGEMTAIQLGLETFKDKPKDKMLFLVDFQAAIISTGYTNFPVTLKCRSCYPNN